MKLAGRELKGWVGWVDGVRFGLGAVDAVGGWLGECST